MNDKGRVLLVTAVVGGAWLLRGRPRPSRSRRPRSRRRRPFGFRPRPLRRTPPRRRPSGRRSRPSCRVRPRPPAIRRAVAPPAGGAVCPPGDAGWFVNAELDFLKPHLKDQLTGTVTFPNGLTDTFQTPAVSLPWTVAPRLEAGFNFGDDFGSLSAAYRFLVSQGNGTVSTDGSTFDVRSRLSLDEFDFDYISGRYSPGPFWELKWRIGARLADVYFDSRADDGVLFQQASNNFIGAGPHFGADAERRIGLLPGLSLIGQADAAVLVGQIKQHFSEGFDGTSFFGDDEERRTQTVPTLNLQAGFRYTPPPLDFFHVTAGYEFEQWWDIGRLGGSHGDLTSQGIFLRGELDY